MWHRTTRLSLSYKARHENINSSQHQHGSDCLFVSFAIKSKELKQQYSFYKTPVEDRAATNVGHCPVIKSMNLKTHMP